MIRKNIPNMAKNARAMPGEEALKQRSVNKRRSTMGWSVVHSRRVNRASATPATAKVNKLIDSVEGMTKAAAAPMTARAAMLVGTLPACVAMTAATRNSTSPACSAPLRP